MSININIPLVALAAVLALIPFNSSAEHGGVVCTLEGVDIADNPPVIEGTNSGETIDCHASPIGHDIYGYGGNDTIIGSDYANFIAGGGANDTIYGGDGNDAIDGGASDDDIYGGLGDDIIFGGVGSSPASGVGCVLLTAAAGSSYLAKGGSGDDEIYGEEGNDCINAGSGEDLLVGGPGNDTLLGGNHADILDGGLGYDYLDGGWHTDTCVDAIDDDNEDIINCETIVGGLEDPDGEDPSGDDGAGGGPDCVKKPDHWKCS
jgi:Ca2+-binding RTX toxin-like protein